jgi:hypothetical protein
MNDGDFSEFDWNVCPWVPNGSVAGQLTPYVFDRIGLTRIADATKIDVQVVITMFRIID